MDTVGCKSCYFIESEIIHTRKERLEDFHVFRHDGFRGPTAPLSVFRGCGDWADVMNKDPMLYSNVCCQGKFGEYFNGNCRRYARG